jgi:hypothetical protein
VKYLPILLIVFLLQSCAYPQFDKALYRDIPLHTISVGMSKSEVRSALGNPYNVIGSKKYKEGIVEVWEYRRYEMSQTKSYDPILEQYWIYFWDSKLEQWGRPGDWDKEADRIWEIRVK